jgi:4-diphosphocytidyl-2C-methyl-D-erythritol kinase
LNASGADHFILSGSGSTYFGLYDSSTDAFDGLRRVETEVERRGLRHRGTWVVRPAGHGARLA